MTTKTKEHKDLEARLEVVRIIVSETKQWEKRNPNEYSGRIPKKLLVDFSYSQERGYSLSVSPITPLVKLPGAIISLPINTIYSGFSSEVAILYNRVSEDVKDAQDFIYELNKRTIELREKK